MITPPREGKGRPSILSQPLPNDVLLALKYRSEGLSWKKSAIKAGMTYDRLRNYTRSHPQVKEVLKEFTQQTLDESHSLLIQSAPLAAKVLVGIIKDEKIKAYSKIEAIKTLFAIVDKGVTDRQQQEQLTELKEQLAALEGGKIVDIN
tara:strand:- start:54 stop:497 length:444 start_codon:yes stop_codon:yes gene_type:complete